MQNLTVLNQSQSQTLTMTSREIADLTNKRHDHVMRDIKVMLDSLGVTHPTFGGSYKDTTGRSLPLFNLPKRETIILVSGYNVELRARIIDRWQELENQQQQFSIPTTLSGALRLAAEQAETIEQQSEQLALAAPKVEFVDKYVDSTGLKTFREVCKLLKVKENEFREFLVNTKVFYKLGGKWCAYSNHIDAGRFKVVAGVNNGYAYSQSLFTTKGIEWIAARWATYALINELKRVSKKSSVDDNKNNLTNDNSQHPACGHIQDNNLDDSYTEDCGFIPSNPWDKCPYC